METSDSECFESADEDFDIKEGKTVEDEVEKRTTKGEKKSTLLTSTLSNKVEEKRRQHEIRRNERLETALPVVPKVPEPVKPSEDEDGWNWEDLDTIPTLHAPLEETASHKAMTTNEYEHVQPSLSGSQPAAWGVSLNANQQPEESDCKPQEEESGWNWEDVDWEPVTRQNCDGEENHTSGKTETANSFTKPSGEPEKSWSTWGTWNVSNLLTTASSGMSTLTSHVTTALESGIGAPDPVQLAQLHKSLEDDAPSEEINSAFNLGNLMSGVTQITKLVESTGNKVISGGLDTLETIGKKTMQVLQEGDPGLKKKRAFFQIDSDKIFLSEVLREAKEKTETQNKMLEESDFLKRPNYECFFDDCQGLVHLEALEMLSKQCTMKIQSVLESLSGEDLVSMQETLKQIEELCELSEEEEDKVLSNTEIEESLDAIMVEINVPLTFKKMISTWNEAEQWLDELKLPVCNERELYIEAIKILAQVTALAVENFHKIAELILVKEHRSTVDESDNLVQLTTLLTTLIRNVAKRLSDKLNEKGAHLSNADSVKEFITNIFYEAENSNSYIRNSFQLLLPIIQVGVL